MKGYPASLLLLNGASVARLMSILPKGKKNAITMADVQEHLGVRRQRTAETARALVKYAIEEHHMVVCTGSHGVWIPLNVDDVKGYIKSLESRQRSIGVRIKAVTEAVGVRTDWDL